MEGLRLLGGFDNADSMDVGGDNLKPWAIFASPVGSDGVPTRAAALMEAGASGSELNGRYGEMVAFSTFGERENYDVDNAYAYEWLESEYGDLGAYQEDGRCHLDWDKVAEDFGSITLTPKGFREIVVEGGKLGWESPATVIPDPTAIDRDGATVELCEFEGEGSGPSDVENAAEDGGGPVKTEGGEAAGDVEATGDGSAGTDAVEAEETPDAEVTVGETDEAPGAVAEEANGEAVATESADTEDAKPETGEKADGGSVESTDGASEADGDEGGGASLLESLSDALSDAIGSGGKLYAMGLSVGEGGVDSSGAERTETIGVKGPAGAFVAAKWTPTSTYQSSREETLVNSEERERGLEAANSGASFRLSDDADVFEIDSIADYRDLEDRFGDFAAYEKDGACRIDWEKAANEYGAIVLTENGARECVDEADPGLDADAEGGPLKEWGGPLTLVLDASAVEASTAENVESGHDWVESPLTGEALDMNEAAEAATYRSDVAASSTDDAPSKDASEVDAKPSPDGGMATAEGAAEPSGKAASDGTANDGKEPKDKADAPRKASPLEGVLSGIEPKTGLYARSGVEELNGGAKVETRVYFMDGRPIKAFQVFSVGTDVKGYREADVKDGKAEFGAWNSDGAESMSVRDAVRGFEAGAFGYGNGPVREVEGLGSSRVELRSTTESANGRGIETVHFRAEVWDDAEKRNGRTTEVTFHPSIGKIEVKGGNLDGVVGSPKEEKDGKAVRVGRSMDKSEFTEALKEDFVERSGIRGGVDSGRGIGFGRVSRGVRGNSETIAVPVTMGRDDVVRGVAEMEIGPDGATFTLRENDGTEIWKLAGEAAAEKVAALQDASSDSGSKREFMIDLFGDGLEAFKSDVRDKVEFTQDERKDAVAAAEFSGRGVERSAEAEMDFDRAASKVPDFLKAVLGVSNALDKAEVREAKVEPGEKSLYFRADLGDSKRDGSRDAKSGFMEVVERKEWVVGGDVVKTVEKSAATDGKGNKMIGTVTKEPTRGIFEKTATVVDKDGDPKERRSHFESKPSEGVAKTVDVKETFSKDGACSSRDSETRMERKTKDGTYRSVEKDSWKATDGGTERSRSKNVTSMKADGFGFEKRTTEKVTKSEGKTVTVRTSDVDYYAKPKDPMSRSGTEKVASTRDFETVMKVGGFLSGKVETEKTLPGGRTVWTVESTKLGGMFKTTDMKVIHDEKRHGFKIEAGGRSRWMSEGSIRHDLESAAKKSDDPEDKGRKFSKDDLMQAAKAEAMDMKERFGSGNADRKSLSDIAWGSLDKWLEREAGGVLPRWLTNDDNGRKDGVEAGYRMNDVDVGNSNSFGSMDQGFSGWNGGFDQGIGGF